MPAIMDGKERCIYIDKEIFYLLICCFIVYGYAISCSGIFFIFHMG